ncbi:HAD family hydrolase [Streptomyces sp. NPDC058221]|uniref:HAD family hydrolase n=1 Tax=Streptomyces sp. NPDC058221 TaxID=3346388 RepID=UPI0036E37749
MTHPHPRELQTLFASAKCVFLDFDGPVCDLFSDHTSVLIADVLVQELVALGADPALVRAHEGGHDPLAILKAVADAGAGRALVAGLESRLTDEETRAAKSADPTPGADELIRLLHEAEYKLAVTTNNSAQSVARYLDRQGTADFFGTEEHRRIHGRTAHPMRLKPDPDCLFRALESTGSAAADALMIGDSRADLLAAEALGVPFIGYAKNDRKRAQLGFGTGVVVRRLHSLVEVVRCAVAEQH